MPSPGSGRYGVAYLKGVDEANMGRSLEELLDSEPAAEEPQALEPVEEPQVEPEPQPRDESGKFAAKGVDVEPAQEPEPQSVSPTEQLSREEYAAMKGERERRQKAEREAQDLRDRLAALEQQRAEPPAPPPSVWEDEHEYGNHLVSAAVQQSLYQSKLTTSEMMARQAHSDFGDVWEPMNRFLMDNPVLLKQATEDAHPWDYAYRAYKNQQTMQELGATDLASVRAKMREEIMAELQAQVPVTKPMAPTLSTQRNVGARSGPAWSGPTPLSDLLD